MRIHDGLIKVARELAMADQSGRPRQANIRRAVSTAYYALFHCLIDQACGLIIGKDNSLTRQRHNLARAFGHRTMSEISKEFIKPTPHAKIANAIDNQSVPQDIQTVAKAFVELQQRRHDADYNLNKSITRRNAIKLIDEAENAIAKSCIISDSPVGRVYLTALLVGDRLKA